MILQNKNRSRIMVASLILLSVLLSACSRISLTPEKKPPSVAPDLVTRTIPPQAGGTIEPEATETLASNQPGILLVAPPTGNPVWVDEIKPILVTLAEQESLHLSVVSSLSTGLLSPGIAYVVIIGPFAGAAEWIASAPEIQFITVGIPDLPPLPNLSVMGSTGLRTDQIGFVAGYTAALMTKDWRVGVISLADSIDSKSARSGFMNGVRYYCGLCRPVYPPYIEYPIFYEIYAASNQIETQAAIDFMQSRAVNTLYIVPDAMSASLIEAVSASGLRLLGGGFLDPALSDLWIAGISRDTANAFRQIWDDIHSGKSAEEQPIDIKINVTDPAVLTPGKLQVAQHLVERLLSGEVDSGINLTTGENRY